MTSIKGSPDWWKSGFGTAYRERYKDFCQITTEPVADFLSEVLPRGARTLDLGCGDGRITNALNCRGFQVIGFDYSRELLDIAGPGPFVQGDMRELDSEQQFDATISIFTSFGYFDDARDDVLVLENIFRSLKKGGVLVLDLSVPKNDDEFLYFQYGAGVERVSGRYRQYSEQDLRDMLREVGLQTQTVHWWYSSKPLVGDPRRMIFIARRPI